MTVRVLLATRNPNKLTELRQILVEQHREGVEVVGLSDVPAFPERPETGTTFAENALAKARDAAAASGLPAVADDSGLSIDALNGMPGVLSARWSGEQGNDEANLRLVLAQLRDVPDGRRSAAFVCAVALVVPGGEETTVTRHWQGVIAHTARGSGGFGYDPIFFPSGLPRTAAELDPGEKDSLSHRGQAMRAMAPHLSELGRG